MTASNLCDTTQNCASLQLGHNEYSFVSYPFAHNAVFILSLSDFYHAESKVYNGWGNVCQHF